MRRLALFAFAVLLLQATASSAVAQSADSTKAKPAAAAIEGKWRGAIETPNGSMDANCQIKKEKDGYSGTISGPEGDVPLRNIVLDGDKLTAGATISMQGSSLELLYTFVLKDDTLSGSVSTNFNGQAMAFDLVMKRVTEK